MGWGHLKYFTQELYLARKAEIYMEAFRHNAKVSLLKSWSPGVGWGHNRGNCFYMCLYRKNSFKILGEK
jgi:hypothetical protein